MSAQGVAVLLGWLSCCVSGLWRYHTKSPSYRIFSTRSTIKLEYEGTSFIGWSIPDTCTVENERSPTTQLRCLSPGIQAIKPLVLNTTEEEEERYLSVDNSHICFMWYYKIVNYYDNLTQAIIIWVYDPESSEEAEVQMRATEPSLSPGVNPRGLKANALWQMDVTHYAPFGKLKYIHVTVDTCSGFIMATSSVETTKKNSQILSEQLDTLGQIPSVYTILKKKIYTVEETMNTGTWVIRVPMTSEDVLKEIKGNQVAFQDCFAANLPFLLTFPISNLPENPAYLPISLPQGSPLLCVWIACVPSCAVLVTDQETYQTNNSFFNWARVRVPPGALSDTERSSVSDVDLSKNGVFFLINGVLYVKTSMSFKKIGRNRGLPEGGILGISTRRWCWVKYLLKSEKRKSLITAWTKNEFYLGYSSYKFFKIISTSKLKAFLKLPPTDTLTIENIEYTGHPLELGLLLNHCVTCTTNKIVYLVIYNEDSAEWTYQDYKLDVSVDNVLSLRFLHSALPEVILWDKHQLYYCYQNFTVTGVIQTDTGQTNLSMLSNGSYIHDVFVDYLGSIVVKMENNIMFYFKINIKDAIKLHLWINSMMKSVFLFSMTSQMYLLYYLPDKKIHPQEYPLSLEIKSVTYKSKERCPYLAFYDNVPSSLNFLDKGENLTVWTQIVYPEEIGLDIIVEVYGPKILELKHTSHYEIAMGYCTKSMETVFSQDTDYEGVHNYFQEEKNNMGLVLIQLRPSEYSKVCSIAQKVFQIAVGCDVHKYISVKGFNRSECHHRDFAYVIDKAYLRHQPSENLKVMYESGKYGCPLKLDFTQKFRPVLQLFDESGYIKDVTANFIMWEIYGRNDYTYNTTMKQSGCLSEAQTWKSMVELNPDIQLEDVWGPQNYRTCFSIAVGKPGDLNQPYEIMNESNNNHLLWPMDHTGMYVFRVRILDPNYSFCNLTTIFAIETYGVIPRPSAYLVAAFMFVLVVLILSLLVLSYFWYMKIYRQYIVEPLNKPPNKQKKS